MVVFNHPYLNPEYFEGSGSPESFEDVIYYTCGIAASYKVTDTSVVLTLEAYFPCCEYSTDLLVVTYSTLTNENFELLELLYQVHGLHTDKSITLSSLLDYVYTICIQKNEEDGCYEVTDIRIQKDTYLNSNDIDSTCDFEDICIGVKKVTEKNSIKNKELMYDVKNSSQRFE